jgi:hypothetical protein
MFPYGTDKGDPRARADSKGNLRNTSEHGQIRRGTEHVVTFSKSGLEALLYFRSTPSK